MKAKINTLIILIAIFTVSLIAGILSGCSIGEKNAKERADELGMTAVVTYYTNGGNFGSSENETDDKAYRTDYYYPDTPIFNIGVDATVGQPLNIFRAGYVFTGWEYAELDSEGLPKLYELNSNGELTSTKLPVLESGSASIIGSTGRELLEQEKRFGAIPNGTKVFANGHPKVGAGEHVYLAATWEKDIVLEYKLITDKPITVEENGVTKTYNNGDTIYERGFLSSDVMTLIPDTTPTTFSGFSYIHLYWDAEGENAVVAGEQVSKGNDGTNPVIYAKYLSGNWTAVKTANQTANMLRATGNGNYFVVYDIDCTVTTNFSYKTLGTFGGVIEGNGKTISNISITATLQNPISGSIFGNLNANAKIKNLTIENVSIALTLNGSMSAYVLVSDVAEGAVFENFKLDTVTFNIKMSQTAELKNIQYVSGEYEKDNWLYGAFDTDAEFIEKYGNIVQNATLIINNSEIVSGGHQ